MRRSTQPVTDVKPGDLIVTASGERMRVTHIHPYSDRNVIIHGTTVHGREGMPHPVDSTVTRLD